MSEQPKVSVIIPVFNGEKFLPDAVASIHRQDYPSIEVIIIDDGSGDNSATIAKDLIAGSEANSGVVMRYFYQENRGLPGARNAGLARVTGEFIGFLDVDDVWSDGKLRLQVPMLTAEPDTGIVIGQSQKTVLVVNKDEPSQFKPVGAPAIGLSMSYALIRRSVFDLVGQFDETQRYCDDWDWYMRAREAGVVIRTHEDLVHEYRRHETNMTNDMETGNRYTLMMLKKSLDRRRQQTTGEAGSLPDLKRQK